MKEPSPGAAVPSSVLRLRGAGPEHVRDLLAAEEPLEIRLAGEGGTAPDRFVVTMRTPGDDADLAVGLLFGEGVIRSADEVVSVDRPSDPRIDPELARNVAVVTLTKDPGRKERTPRRATVMGSACGVCGRTTVEEVIGLAARCRGGLAPRTGMSTVRISPATLTSLPGKLLTRQTGFAATGGLHAAGLFDEQGNLLLAREDVGRHNATDKSIGAVLRSHQPVPPVLLVSGRLGFEIAQKAALAGIRIVAAVSAPTSLAVDLADEAGITLVGFLRGETYNVYTHAGRIRE